MSTTTPVHMSIRGICERHDVCRSHLYEVIGAGKIEAVKNGRRILVRVASADAHFGALPPANIRPTKRTRARMAQPETRPA